MPARHVLPALLALLSVSSTSCALLGQLLQKPTISLRSVDLTDLSFSGIAANFVMDVKNPNPFGVDLARLGYRLEFDGKQLVEGKGDQAVSIPPQGQGVVTLPVSIRFVELGQSLQALFSKEQLPYRIAIAPGFNTPAGVIDVPLSHEGQFPVPRLPDVRLGTPQIGGIDLTGASFSLPLEIANRNGYALPISSLQYAVTIAGQPLISAGASPGSLAANQSTRVPITARVDFLRVGLGVANAIRSGSASVGLTGALDLAGYKLPLNLSTTLRR